MSAENNEQTPDQSIQERTETMSPQDREAYLDGLVGSPGAEGAEIGKGFIRDSEKAQTKAEEEKRDIEIAEKTGLPKEYVTASYDLFTSAESPIGLSKDEIEGMLVNLSKQPNAKETLDKLFNATNTYNDRLWNSVTEAIGADSASLSDLEEGENPGDIKLTKKGHYKSNGVTHLSDTFHEVMNRCHRESVNYDGLGDSLHDQQVRTALERAEFEGTWYRVQDIKDGVSNASTGEVDKTSSRDKDVLDALEQMLTARDEVVRSSVGWGTRSS